MSKKLLAAGISILQLRAKKESLKQKCLLLEQLEGPCKEKNIPLIINDDLQAVKNFEGIGLHIGQDDLNDEIAREQLGPDRILGLSTHSIEEAKKAIHSRAKLNYFAFGPIFKTQTKPDYTPVGIEIIQSITQLKSPIPWVCIGGINSQNVEAILQKNCPGIASVSHVLLAQNPEKIVKKLKQKILESRSKSNFNLNRKNLDQSLNA